MSYKWLCNGCHTTNPDEKPRCGFCGKEKPRQFDLNAAEAVEDDKLGNQLHSIIEKLTPLQRKKLYRYLEDNIL